jgi:hypothetical protein
VRAAAQLGEAAMCLSMVSSGHRLRAMPKTRTAIVTTNNGAQRRIWRSGARRRRRCRAVTGMDPFQGTSRKSPLGGDETVTARSREVLPYEPERLARKSGHHRAASPASPSSERPPITGWRTRRRTSAPGPADVVNRAASCQPLAPVGSSVDRRERRSDVDIVPVRSRAVESDTPAAKYACRIY